MSEIYKQHKRHGQFSSFQDLIFDLKMLRFSESYLLFLFSECYLAKLPIFLGPEGILFLSDDKQTLYFLFQMLNFF